VVDSAFCLLLLCREFILRLRQGQLEIPASVNHTSITTTAPKLHHNGIVLSTVVPGVEGGGDAWL
jgi:hypothetical protein